MRIGELAERTGVPARLLRYYEGMDTRIRCLARNRDAITAYINAVRRP